MSQFSIEAVGFATTYSFNYEVLQLMKAKFFETYNQLMFESFDLLKGIYKQKLATFKLCQHTKRVIEEKYEGERLDTETFADKF